MYTAILIVLSLLSTTVMGQSADGALRPELEALHAKWFRAFDSGDGATMDQMEVDNLALVMPVGFIWSKTEARAGKQTKLNPQIERTLSEVLVRRFGIQLSSLAFLQPSRLLRTRRKLRPWCSYKTRAGGR
jgi:hypothetical protein